MADDKPLAGPCDARSINLGEPDDIAYWTRTLGVSEAVLREAIAAAGPSVEPVREYLGSGS